MNQRATETGLALLGLLMTIACSVRTPAPPHNRAADLGGTSWQLVRFQGGDDKLLRLNARLSINTGRTVQRWRCSYINLILCPPTAVKNSRSAVIFGSGTQSPFSR